MNKLWKILSAMLVTAIVTAMFALPAFAADYADDDKATGGTTTFQKYFVVKKDVEFPSVEFTYTIGTGAAIGPAAGKMEVFAGVDADKVTVGTADFTTTPAQADVYDSVQTNDILTLGADEKYAKKTVTIDFSAVKFAEPGVYRYTLQENPCANPAINCDSTVYSVDVYVIDTNGKLSVAAYTIHTGTDAPDSTAGTTATAVTGKIDGIVNKYPTAGLYVGKVVAGNQGSRDKYFKITVSLTGLVPGSVLTVDLANADPASGTNTATAEAYRNLTNATSLTANNSGEISQNFYIQNGQYIAIYGITSGAEYIVTEDYEDYESVDSKTTPFTISSKTFNGDKEGTFGTEDIYTGFTNTRNGVIPTGVLMAIGPVVVIGIIVVGGIVFLAVRNTKRKASEVAEDEADS